jgi:hypothetical protein
MVCLDIQIDMSICQMMSRRRRGEESRVVHENRPLVAFHRGNKALTIIGPVKAGSDR